MPVDNIPPGYRFYRPLIEGVAARFGLDPLVVAAVCWQESGFSADGFRFEPKFWNRYLKHVPRWSAHNPRRISSSYGLMQVMAVVAIEDGTLLATEPPEVLFTPERGLIAGCTRLLNLSTWAYRLPLSEADKQLATLAAYNGGRGANDKPPFRNGAYAREVLAKLAVLQRGQPPATPSTTT